MIKSFNFLRRKNSFCSFQRYYSLSSLQSKICIVGSGPAAFYTAQQLIRDENVKVDILEKLPVPFGLIRYGVAPDHPEIQNVTAGFTRTALHEHCNFYGNIDVGKDIKVSELLNFYHAVVLAFGASEDKLLGIPGESSKNVFPARTIVGWYTGHPDFIDPKIDLDTDTAVVVGQGNVGLDVARILLRDLDELKVTDISEHAFEALKKSRIRRVILAGRRGPLQAAFTIKEFREMTNLKGCQTLLNDRILKEINKYQEELDLDRPKKRLLELMNQVREKSRDSQAEENSKYFDVRFLRTPKKIIPDCEGKVEKIEFKLNNIKDLANRKSKCTITDKEEHVECGLVIRSVGYKSCPIDPFLPFDDRKHIIPNTGGKVTGQKGLYCSGWVKTGPIGVLVSTMHGSFETAEVLLEDIKKGELSRDLPEENLLDFLKNKGVKYVDFNHWQNLSELEIEKGKEMGKCRTKFYSVQDMLNPVGSS